MGRTARLQPGDWGVRGWFRRGFGVVQANTQFHYYLLSHLLLLLFFWVAGGGGGGHFDYFVKIQARVKLPTTISD